MRNRLWATASILAAVCLLAAFAWWYRVNVGNKSDSSLTSTVAKSPHVAEHVCTECHSEEATDHQSSGHADTFHTTVESEAARWLNNRTFDDPERPYSYAYHFDEETGLSVSIPKQFGTESFPLPYVLGSGHNALTFLSLVPDRLGDTIGVEHRVSLYRNDDGWDLDLTPGQRTHLPQQEVEHFGKVMRGDKLTSCVACHTTEGEIFRQRIEDLNPHVGCQNCHGPGREHVTAVENDTQDGYIGFTEQSAREEVDMCGRCHRSAHMDANEKESPNDIRIVRFQSVGLVQSRCFTASDGRLRCTTCHDPHKTVSRDAIHYVDRCLDCHRKPDAASCPVSPRTNCIQCHMPAIDVHRGIEFHDHWIRVRSDVPEATSTKDSDE